MGLINNMVACYILALALIAHLSLVLCIHQQDQQSQVLNQAKSSLSLDNPTYNCPRFPTQFYEYTSQLNVLIPSYLISIVEDIFKLASVDLVNVLIWFGTLAVFGDILLILYYTIIKPLNFLKSILGAVVRGIIVAFILALVIFALGEEGIIKEYPILKNATFLESLYQSGKSWIIFFAEKIQKLLEKQN